MIPILICLAIIPISTVIGVINCRNMPHDRTDSGLNGFVAGLVIALVTWFVWQAAGSIINTHTVTEHNYIPIVSLQDGSQINGEFYGGLFVARGTIDQVEYFSFYRSNGDGSYSLDKVLASSSRIIPDATPETARLESVSQLTYCEKKWWSRWCSAASGIYVHGDFHVPANSIKNDFVLDAQ